jgi:hypothetical protein
MKKRVLALGTVWLVAVLVSLGPASAPVAPAAADMSVQSKVGRAVAGGLVVALAPVGSLVGCGGGGGRPTSATAVPLP